MGKDLDVDPRLVHFLQAQTAKIIEPFVGLIAAASGPPKWLANSRSQ